MHSPLHTKNLSKTRGGVVIAYTWLLSTLLFVSILPVASSAQERAEEFPSASISSITRSNSSGGLIVRGEALPRMTINIELISDEDGPLVREQTKSDEAGQWDITLSTASFPDGAYTLSVIVQDERGILGPVTQVRGYKVDPKPLLSVNGVRFGWFDAFFGLLVLVFIALSVGSWYYEHRRRIHEEHIFMAERDIQTASDNLIDEVQRLDHLIRESKGLDPQITAEAEYLIKNHQSKIEKMRGYVSGGLRRAT